ncbi:hypothetical protein [Halomonas urumqiensis]|nr:hypothetical protein [Halomonas urumqiensis]GHE21024.1 hypothetical protein GCM10017767_15450 [Halomonas urumqiensis]
MLLTLAAAVVALWYLTSYSLRGGGDMSWLAVETPCDLHVGPCTATAEERLVTFEMGSDGAIHALERVPLSVSLASVEAESVMVEFVGRDMDMGLHRFPLARDADGVFRGHGQVSLCTESVMPWQARVVATTANGRVGGQFDFDVERQAP